MIYDYNQKAKDEHANSDLDADILNLLYSELKKCESKDSENKTTDNGITQ